MYSIKEKINQGYLFGYIFTIVLGSFQGGFACVSFNPIMRIIIKMYKWEDNEIINYYRGLISMMIPLGCLIGSFLSCIFSEIGRRQTMLICNAFIICGSAISLYENLYLLILGRLIQGIGIGIISMIIPKFIREISPKQIAGLLGCFHQMLGVTGTILPMILSLGLPTNDNDIGSNQIWRIINSIPILISFIQINLFFFLFVFDTPFYYLRQNNQDKAEKSLLYIYKTKEEKDIALKDIIELIDCTCKLKTIQFSDLVGPQYFKALIIGIGMNFFQQASGMNSLNFYSTLIFSRNGKYNAAIPNILFTSSKLVAVLITILTIESLGRKKIYVIGSSVTMLMTLCIFISYDIDSYLCLICCVILFAFFFGFSLGPINSIYCAEILPPLGLAITTTINSICVCFLVFFTPVIFEYIHHYLFLIFAFFLFCVNLIRLIYLDYF